MRSEYICRIARAIHRSGTHSVSQSIAIAVSRAKAWARGADGVTAKTKVKAAKAVAEWESKKKAAKLDNAVKASDSNLVLNLSSYNVEDIRKQYPSGGLTGQDGNYRWVRELWNDHLIVEYERAGEPVKLFKVPYTVDDSGKATFGDETEVKTVYIDIAEPSLKTSLTDAQLEKATLIPCTAKDNLTLLSSVIKYSAMKAEYLELLRFSAGKPNLTSLLEHQISEGR